MKTVACVYSRPDGRRIAEFSDRTKTPYARLVAAVKVGRTLTAEEVVHHVNGDPSDDTFQNLEVLSGQREHARIHGPASAAVRWNRERHCAECGVEVSLRTRNCVVCANRHRRYEVAGKAFVPPRTECSGCGCPFDVKTPRCAVCHQRHYRRSAR